MEEGEGVGEGGAMEDRGGRDDRDSRLPKSTLYTSDRMLLLVRESHKKVPKKILGGRETQ